VTVTLNITPEAEAILLAEADSAGLPLEQFLSRHLETLVRASPPPISASRVLAADPKQREHDFDEWLDSFPQGTVLSDDALKRENWYPDRW
jgi:hypothetical protein